MVEKLEQDYGILKRMATELADELEQEIKDRYEDMSAHIHPALMAKFNRDMATVHEARELIGGDGA
jgi:hypothetical protein